MDIPTHLQQPTSGNRSRASSAASRYTPESYRASSPFTQPNTQGGYQPPAPPMQQNYPQGGNDAFLMIPPSSQPGVPDPQAFPNRESSTPNPPYPISADDPYMRPASHSRHASHSSARSHRSRASSHRSNRHDEDETDRHHGHHHQQHHQQHHRHHSHSGQYNDDNEGGHHHPLRQSERANSDVSDLRPLRRRDTRRPTLGDTVVAMWDGLKSVLGPRDRK